MIKGRIGGGKFTPKEAASTEEYPVPVQGSLEIFDERGVLATLEIKTVNVIMFCENDGGSHWRAEVVEKIDKKNLARALKPRAHFAKYVALARLRSEKAQAALPADKKALQGRLRDGGIVVAKIEPNTSADQEDTDAYLVTAKGHFELGCSNP